MQKTQKAKKYTHITQCHFERLTKTVLTDHNLVESGCRYLSTKHFTRDKEDMYKASDFL